MMNCRARLFENITVNGEQILTFEPSVQEASVQEESAKIIFIYEATYPGHAIRLHLYQGNNITGNVVDVFLGDHIPKADVLRPGYLGLVIAGAKKSGMPVVNVFASLPRHATAEEAANFNEARALRSRRTRVLFRLSPMLFEQAKFLIEQRWAHKTMHRSLWTKLPRGRNATAPAPAEAGRVKKKRPAILIGFHWLEHGGAEKLGFDTVHWALEAGLRVFVMAEKESLHRLADRLPQHEDVQFLRTDQYLPRHKVSLFVRNLVVQENIRAIHIHHCLPLYEALPSIKIAFPDVKVLDSTHIIEFHNGGYARISGEWSNFVDYHHVISRKLADMYLQRFKVRSKVQLGRLITRDSVKDVQKTFSIETGRGSYRFAFVGRMSHQKRPVLLALMLRALMAWGRVNGKSLSFDVVGEGPYLKVFKRLLAKYHLGDVTYMHSADADVHKIMAQADILLLPSANEGLALVCYEAIQQGTIPVSSDVGAQSEIVPPELLLAPNPRLAVKQVVEIVTRLTGDAAFLAQVKSELSARLATIAKDATAHEVLLPIYKSFTKGERY